MAQSTTKKAQGSFDPTQFFKAFQVPSLDDVVTANKRTSDALKKAGDIYAATFQTLLQNQFDAAQVATKEHLTTLRSLADAKSGEDYLEKQISFAQQRVQEGVEHAQNAARALEKAHTQAHDVLRKNAEEQVNVFTSQVASPAATK